MSGKNFGASHLANEGHDNVDIRRLRFRDRAWPHSDGMVNIRRKLIYIGSHFK